MTTNETRAQYLDALVQRITADIQLHQDRHDGLYHKPIIVMHKPFDADWTHVEYNSREDAVKHHPGLRTHRAYGINGLPENGAVMIDRYTAARELAAKPLRPQAAYYD